MPSVATAAMEQAKEALAKSQVAQVEAEAAKVNEAEKVAAAAKAAEALNDAGTPTQKPSGENDEQPIDE